MRLRRGSAWIKLPRNREDFMAQAFTVNEAAALIGLEEKTVRKEVEYGLFGSESPPRFSLPALVYFRVLVLLGLQPSVEERKRIYALITKAFARSKRPAKVDVSPVLELKLGDVTEEVEDRLARFEAWKKKIVVDPEILGGEPVFAKSRLAVRRVGTMMLRGRANAEQEIREDHPSLKSEDIEFAKLYTLAYPRIGRPRDRKAPAR
jgi:uncharacterized protein (DUF433 family)